MDWLDGLDPYWIWLTLGLLLAGLEMLVPGVYLIWFAVAALATGALTWAFDLGPAMQIIDFIFLSLIAAYSARRFLRDRPIQSSDPLLNNRGGRLVGQTGVVTQEIDEGGSGRVKIGDSEWIAYGPQLPVGARVRITGLEGAILLVEPLNRLKDNGTAPPEPA